MTDGARSSRSRVFVVLAIVALIASGVAYGAWTHFAGRESTEDAQVDGHINPVSTRVGGTVSAVNVKENQRVEAGTILVQIDTRDTEIALARAEADLADAQANYEAARTGLPVVSTETGSRLSASQATLLRTQGGMESAQKEVESAQARLAVSRAREIEAQVTAARTAKDLERWKKLVSKDEVSQQQYDGAESANDAAKAAVASAQAAIAEAEAGVAAAQSRIKQARGAMAEAEAGVQAANAGPQQVASTKAGIEAVAARIEQAKAAINQARLNIEYATIKAPVSGLVSRKNVEVGQVVQPGQPLLAIVPLEEVWVTANFKETQLDKMRPGQAATISVDAYDGASFTGHVESISAATGARFSLLPPENASGNYVKVVQRIPVRIQLDRNADPEHVLRPGMSVVASVQTVPQK